MTVRRDRQGIRIVGLVLAVVGIGGLVASSLVPGRIGWRNAWGQPVTIYLVVTLAVILGVIGILNVLVWRPQRRRREQG